MNIIPLPLYFKFNLEFTQTCTIDTIAFCLLNERTNESTFLENRFYKTKMLNCKKRVLAVLILKIIYFNVIFL